MEKENMSFLREILIVLKLQIVAKGSWITNAIN